MKIKDSIKQMVQKDMSEITVDIDIEFCKKNNIKYKNDEVDASKIDLFNSKSNKAAFDFVTRNH